MSGSIRKRVALSTVLVLFLFVSIAFAASYYAVSQISSRYQEAAVTAALDFAELTIDADAAKECFSTRNRTDEYQTVQNKIFFDMNTGAEHLSQALYDANHDGMTQHLNKRCYHTMEETFRSCEQLCVVYFDVNNLKLMNDTNGHESGDCVISDFADDFGFDGELYIMSGGDLIYSSLSPKRRALS